MSTVILFPTPRTRAAAAVAAFAANAKARRVELGKSQAAVAEAAGCEQSTVARVEGGADPALSTAVAIAHALDSDLATLTTPAEKAAPGRRRKVG